MKKIISLSLFALITSTSALSQDITESSNVNNIIQEDFNDVETVFPILTSVDNYFIIDNGDYLLSRNNTESEYAILASTENNISDFTLKTAIKLGPSSNKRSSAGVLIKAQTNGTGALVFEVNRKGEYRIKELTINQTYKYLSGKTSNEGWVKNKNINGQDEFNGIEVICKENVYDIYINNHFLTTLFTPSLGSGKMGILIGRDAKARVAYYYLSIPSEVSNNLIDEHMDDFNVTNLTNKIKQLESENLTLSNSNQRLTKENETLINSDELTKITSNLHNLNSTKDSLINVLNGIRNDLEATNNLLSEERKNLSAANSELDRGNKMIAEFDVKRKEFTVTITNLENKNSELESNINTLNNEVSSAKNRLDNQKELNKELTTNNTKLSDENKNLTSKLNTSKNNSENKSSEITSLKSEKSNLTKEVKKKNTEITNLQSKINTSKSESNSLQTKVNTLRNELKNLESKLSELREKSSTTSSDLKKEISSKKSEITSLNSKLSNANNELKNLKKKYTSYDKLENTNTELSTKLSNKESEISTLSTQLNNLRNQVSTLTSERDNLTVSEKEKSDKISSLSILITELNTKVENMKKVLIYKGFEESGVDSESVSTTKVENKNSAKKSTNKGNKKQQVNKNVTYSVHIATYSSKVSVSQFKGLNGNVFPVSTENGTIQYMSGNFDNSNNAIEHRNNLMKLGYKNAFVVELNNN